MPAYDYYLVFEEYGSRLRDLLLNGNDRPYPLYESYNDLVNDAYNTYKGLLVWESAKYYKTVVDANQVTQIPRDDYQKIVGYFIVPEFSNVDIIPNFEYKQLIVISFDTCVEPDFDPFQKKVIQTIDWFINQHKLLIEMLNEGFLLSDNRSIIAHISNISRPIISANSSYVRRSVTITLRYCGLRYC